MKSEVKVYPRENGGIQRVHVTRWENWEQLDFLWMNQESLDEQVKALGCFRDIYVNFLVPAKPWIFPQMAMFTLPDEIEVDELLKAVSFEKKDDIYVSSQFGMVKDKLTAVSIALQKGVKIKGKKPVFASDAVRAFWEKL